MSKVCLTFAVYQGSRLLRHEELSQNIVRIGKDPRSHLRLEDPVAARMHAVLEVAHENDVTLIDLGQDAGTFVNGTRVNKCHLVKGDELRIGDTRFVLERITEQTGYVAPSNDVPATAKNDNPFLAPRLNFFSSPRTNPALNTDGFDTSFTYAMVKSGPAVDPDEVELANVTAVEVMVLWGQNVLHVAHLRPGESFAVGEEQGKNVGCDFFIPAEKLGVTRMPIVTSDRAGATAFIPDLAKGRAELVGQPTMALKDLRARGELCQQTFGGHQVPLVRGTQLRIEIADFVIRVAAVNAGKPTKKGLAAGVDLAAIGSFGMSFAAVGSFIATMAFLMPSLNGLEDTEVTQDQLYLMQQFLVAAAEREQDSKPTEEVADVDADDREGGTGTRAKNEEGAMGSAVSRATNHRYAVKRNPDNPEPHLAREAQLADARTFGTIGLLNAGLAGDPKAPTAPWGQTDSSGNDEVSANGNMWGDEIGESYGPGGIGLSGLGEGGGGHGEGIGLGSFGALGHGAGLGDGQGMGHGHGRLLGGHRSKAPPAIRIGKSVVSGRLPPEVIQRIVRQNYGRFRMCYEQGLARNPNLEGRVQKGHRLMDPAPGA